MSNLPSMLIDQHESSGIARCQRFPEAVQVVVLDEIGQVVDLDGMGQSDSISRIYSVDSPPMKIYTSTVPEQA